jgi:hypothetical protein
MTPEATSVVSSLSFVIYGLSLNEMRGEEVIELDVSVDT